jgi:hypothetical protein
VHARVCVCVCVCVCECVLEEDVQCKSSSTQQSRAQAKRKVLRLIISFLSHSQATESKASLSISSPQHFLHVHSTGNIGNRSCPSCMEQSYILCKDLIPDHVHLLRFLLFHLIYHIDSGFHSGASSVDLLAHTASPLMVNIAWGFFSHRVRS